MNRVIKLDLHTMLRYSEYLMDPSAKIPLTTWLDSYNIAKSRHLKHILQKCIPKVDSLTTTEVFETLEPDCLYDRCDVFVQLLDRSDVNEQAILDWFHELILTTTDTKWEKIKCKNHCTCSLINLAIALVKKGVQWNSYMTPNTLLTFTNKRCCLSRFLDLLYTTIDRKLPDRRYSERVYKDVKRKLKIGDYIPLDGTLDIKNEIIFYGISDGLLFRKFILARLFMLTRMDLIHVTRDYVDQQFLATQEMVSDAINWSYHPLIDLYLENDTMLLKCLYIIVEGQALIIKNELEAHQVIEKFIDSINHDASIIIDWLTCDSEVAELTLRFLLIYLKLPHVKTKCTSPAKLFFNQVLDKAESLWSKGLFPYDPSALIKFREKLVEIPYDIYKDHMFAELEN